MSAALKTASNPIIPMDFPDPDIIRVDDTYYMVTTTMYFMPGCVILRSYDLLHWEYCSRVYAELDRTPGQLLQNGQNIYGQGMWAASLRYAKGMFHICFVANDTHQTYLYRAADITGPWEKSLIDGFYHDCSLLFDDDDRVYIVYGNRQIHLTELRNDLSGPKPGGLDRIIADSGPSGMLGYEGSHFYKISGKYYLFVIHSLKDRWRRVETCLCSDSPEGEFTGGIVFDDDMGYCGQGIAQGAIVDTPDHRWFCCLFQDRGAVGRVPFLLPMTWKDGMPVIGENGKAPATLQNLSTRPGYVYSPLYGSDDFTTPTLQPWWEWNHTPDLTLCSWGQGCLRITNKATASCLTQAVNTLTQRGVYPSCSGEVTLDGSALKEGDCAGLCILQELWAWVGLEKMDGKLCVTMMTRSDDDPPEGKVLCRLPASSPVLRIKACMDFSGMKDEARFMIRTEDEWTPIGTTHSMFFRLSHFTGNRFGLFSYATQQAGGVAKFSHFVYNA